MALIDYTVYCVLYKLAWIWRDFYLANKAIPNKNDVLDILNHMVRLCGQAKNTHGQARDYFSEINSFF